MRRVATFTHPALVIAILLSGWAHIYVFAGRQVRIFGHKIDENGRIHAAQRVTFGPCATFFDNTEYSAIAVDHWDRRDELMNKIKQQEKAVQSAEKHYEKLTEVVEKAKASNKPQAQIAGLVAKQASVAVDIAVARQELERLVKFRDEIRADLSVRDQLMISRDHIVTHAVWTDHLQYAAEEASRHHISISRTQAKDLSDRIMNGPDNLIGMTQLMNKKVKTIVENSRRLEEELQTIGSLIRQAEVVPRLSRLDEYELPVLAKPVPPEVNNIIATDMLLQALLRYLKKPEYIEKRDAVFQMYELWLIENGFGEELAAQLRADLTNRALAFERLMQHRGRLYHIDVEALRIRYPNVDPIPERAQSAGAVFHRSQDFLDICGITESLKAQGFFDD